MNRAPTSIAVLDAPSNLGLSPPASGRDPGVGGLPRALRDLGIVERLGAVDAGAVPPYPYAAEWREGHGVRNAEAIKRFSLDLAGRVGALLAEGRFPLVLGGDCSILLGNTLALRRLGRFGLVFLDGHLDFRHPGNAAFVGAAAGEDLALATGRGDGRLADIDGLGPYVRDRDVVAVGEREDDPATRDIRATAITVWDLAEVRRRGAAAVGRQTVDRMRGSGVRGFWVHLDADVLDDAVMPAVDSRQPDGLGYDELGKLLRPLFGSRLAAGLEVTILDPTLDPDGTIVARFADALVHAVVGHDLEGED